MHVKVVKVAGEFVWHHHEWEDELFLVLKGSLEMRFRDPQPNVVSKRRFSLARSLAHARSLSAGGHDRCG
eukprot:SAG11_NODE_32079_length_286_cov_1.358289_1_plen_69_part_01